MGNTVTTVNDKLLKIYEEGCKDNWNPWYFITKLDELDKWDHPNLRIVLSMYLIKYCTIRENSYTDFKFYDIHLVPRNFWGYDESSDQTQCHLLLLEHKLKIYFDVMMKLIIDDYINKDKHYPLVIYLNNRFESNPPEIVITTLIQSLKNQIPKNINLKIHYIENNEIIIGTSENTIILFNETHKAKEPLDSDDCKNG